MPLTKTGKWTLLSGIVVIEVAGFSAAYTVWNRCNRSQGEDNEAMVMVHNRCPSMYRCRFVCSAVLNILYTTYL